MKFCRVILFLVAICSGCLGGGRAAFSQVIEVAETPPRLQVLLPPPSPPISVYPTPPGVVCDGEQCRLPPVRVTTDCHFSAAAGECATSSAVRFPVLRKISGKVVCTVGRLLRPRGRCR